MSAFVDGNGRPLVVYSKQDVEAQQSRIDPIIGSMLGGPNPFLTDMEDLANETGFDDLSPFINESNVEQRRHSSVYSASHMSVEHSDAITDRTTMTFNDRMAHRNPVASLNIPRDPVGIFTMSMKYAEDNYIVAHGLRVKKNFALKDFQILGSETTRKFYQSEFRRLKMRYWLSHIFRYYWMCGRVVLYWGKERPVPNICMLDPRLIVVRSWMGRKKVYLKPDKRWNELMRQDTPEGRFLKREIPREWIKFIRAEQEIPLEDETYSLIENDLSLFATRGIAPVSGVPLQPAFNALQMLNIHMAGDFSVAWMMKNLIALVSIGDPKAEGEKYTRADQIELQKLKNAFQRPEYALWAYVDPTVMIRFMHPDPKLYATDKYLKPCEIVERVMGLPAVFSAGGTIDFNAATLSLKPFREEIYVGRDDVLDQFLYPFCEILREGYTRSKSGSKSPEFEFDQDSLKDDKAILDELTAKYDRGAVSIQSLLEGKAQDIDTERKRKQGEQKEKSLWTPLFDMNHGDPKAEGGRPNTTGQHTAEGHGGATPRPSTS